MSAAHVWDMLRLCWIDVYNGPPEVIVHDAGTNFDSAEFRKNANSMSVGIKCISTESHHSIGGLERYHGPLRRSFKIIDQELPDTSKKIKLQMAIKAINDTAGPNGIVPTLLVFGAYPRIHSLDPPTPLIIQRATAIRKAMAEVAKIHAERNITDALRQRNGPNTLLIQNTPIGSEVIVWRIHQKKWTGPFKLLSISGEDCIIQMPHGQSKFRTTSVRPFYRTGQIENTPVVYQSEASQDNVTEVGTDRQLVQSTSVEQRI
ncbi:hypothetical protein K3495_g5721 [Podosphaera aphanis]|nr:hypothetical protein K3495_g5721 [Podosphaera aphanis]